MGNKQCRILKQWETFLYSVVRLKYMNVIFPYYPVLNLCVVEEVLMPFLRMSSSAKEFYSFMYL